MKSRKKLLQSLKKLENNRQLQLEILKGSSDLVFGTVYTTMQRCGNPRCKCATVPSHRQTYIRHSEKGVQKCKSVRKADVQEIETAGQEYVKCRDAMKKLKSIYLTETEILKNLMRIRRILYE